MRVERFLTNLVLSHLPVYRIGRHALFWLLCLLFFGTIYGSLIPTGSRDWLLFNPVAFAEAVYFLPAHMFLTYVIIYFLFPRYLFTGKYVKLVIGVLVAVVATAIISLSISIYVVTPWRHWLGIPAARSSVMFGILAGLRGSNTVAGFSAAIKLIKYWYFKKTENELLEKEKLKAELEVLKGQLQPHFLFNTLNNLYSLILQKSEEAPRVVLQLSTLLQYILTESSKHKISLQRELEIIKDYIELEQLRAGKRLQLALNIHGSCEGKIIAPLLLLPFIENAFKHGSNQLLEQPWISLDLAVHDETLKFKLINGKSATMSGIEPPSTGIGLRNVRKRLELLYGGKFNLHQLNEAEAFAINLELQLERG